MTSPADQTSPASPPPSTHAPSELRRDQDADNSARVAITKSRIAVYGPLLLLALTILAYSPVFRADFSRWDDLSWIGENLAVAPKPSLAGLGKQWADAWDGGGVFFNLYSPLTHTVWFGLAWLSQGKGIVSDCLKLPLDPALFHAANVFVHLVSITLVYLLLRRLLRWVSTGASDPAALARPGIDPTWPALIGAGLLALHPINVEAVAWVSDLKDVLCAMLIFAGLLATARASEQTVTGGRAGVWSRAGWGWPVVFLVLAALAKPTAVTFPPMAAAIAIGVYRVPARKLLWPAIASLVVMLPLAYFTAKWQPAVTLLDGAPLPMRPLVATSALGRYVEMLLWPVGYCIDYGLTPGVLVRNWAWVPWTAVALAAAAVVIALRDRVVIIGAVMFVLAVGPVLGLRNFDFAGASVIADHYVYPGMAGLGLMIARLLQKYAKPADSGSGRNLNFSRGLTVGLAVVGGVLFVQCFRQAAVWHNSKTLFESGLRVNPAAVTINSNYADLLAQNRDYEGSLKYALKAIETSPTFAQANHLAGQAYAVLGDPRSALRHYIVCARVYARHAAFQCELGDVYAELNRLDKSVLHYKEALRIDPKHAGTLRNLPRIEAEIARRARMATTTRTSPPGQ